MTMGEKILNMRKARGWSQEELAEQMSFEWFLAKEGLELWYLLSGAAALVCGLFLFGIPLWNYFLGGLFDHGEE